MMPSITIEEFKRHFSDVGTFAHDGIVLDRSAAGQAGECRETYVRSNFSDGTTITTRLHLDSKTSRDEGIDEIYVLTVSHNGTQERSWLMFDAADFGAVQALHAMVAEAIRDKRELAEVFGDIAKKSNVSVRQSAVRVST